MRRWFLLATLLAACSDDPREADDDSPRDAGVDARGPDLDAGKDARTEPRVDASDLDAVVLDAARLDAAVDADIDSGFDAGIDAGPICDAMVAPVLPALRLEAVVDGISALVFAAQPPGSSDWYLVQQTGFIRVLRDGVLLPEVFLDVSAELPAIDERGLLGLAFAPDFAQSGKFYVALTASAGANANQDSVYEYQHAAGVSTRTRTMVQLEASAGNHNGGTVLFGPDGFLYYGTGDGGGACNSDRPGAAQDLGRLFGKILRLDPNAPEPYAAAGNPFAPDAGDPRVLHYGLRNPFRFGFDRATGGLFVGDVGQARYEELDYADAKALGLNFGWPALEGPEADTCGSSPTLALRDGSVDTKPIATFNRTQPNSFSDYVSVIAGPTYRGSALTGLRGVTLFGDYTGARMGALVQCGAQTSEITVLAKNRDPNQPNLAALARPDGSVPLANLTAIVEDYMGELYLVVNNATLYKVVAGE